MRRMRAYRSSGLLRSLTLLRAFLIVSAAILAVGAVALSSTLSADLRAAALDDSALDVSAYTDAVVAPAVDPRERGRRHRSDASSADTDDSPYERRPRAERLRARRTPRFSTTHPERVGRRRSSPELREAIEAGAPSADIVDPTGEQAPVVKVWAPLHSSRGVVVGAAEVTLDDSVVTQIVDDARGTVWFAVVIVFGVLWLVLAVLVRGASARLRSQNEDLAARSHDVVASRASSRRRCSRPSRRSTPPSRRAIRTRPVTHSESGASRWRSGGSSGFPPDSSVRSQPPPSSTTSGRSECRTRS